MLNRYFDIYWENPLKTYNKIKKYFKPIKPEFQWSFGKRNSVSILELTAFDLTWKDKWRTPRHEFNPRIYFSLFNYIHLYISWTIGDDSMNDMVYWEAALYWLYYDKSLQESIKDSMGWTQYNKSTDTYEPIVFKILKEPFQTMYENNELNNCYYEN